MMKRVRWSSQGRSHGMTPNSFIVWRETYSALQHVNLERKSRNSKWWEENLIPQLIQEDPIFLILEGRLTYICQISLWNRKTKAVHGQRGFFIPYAVPWEDPKFAQFSDCNLLSSDFCFSAKKRNKKHCMLRWDILSSHGKPQIPLLWGRRLTHCFSLNHWKWKRKAMHDERSLSSKSWHRQSPLLLIWEGALTQFCHVLLCKRYQ